MQVDLAGQQAKIRWRQAVGEDPQADVITSYSIHYTKLYDRRPRDWALSLWVMMARASTRSPLIRNNFV